MKWDKIIKRARAKRKFGPSSIRKAGRWQTCAVGELRAQYTQLGELNAHYLGCHIELAYPDLYKLGAAFTCAVKNQNVAKASHTYKVIHRLAASLFRSHASIKALSILG